jgi:glycosidase
LDGGKGAGGLGGFQVTTPDWVKHAVFYQIFPDRFARSDSVEKPRNLEPWDDDPTPFGYKGGDLVGVRERLDYLQDLDITALYFNPIFQSACNHRYHPHDYYRVDPLLGGDAAFDNLLAECHRRGLKVVLDGVFNHASRGFFPFNDVLENGPASPWLDWFTFIQHPANAYDHS